MYNLGIKIQQFHHDGPSTVKFIPNSNMVKHGFRNVFDVLKDDEWTFRKYEKTFRKRDYDEKEWLQGIFQVLHEVDKVLFYLEHIIPPKQLLFLMFI